MEQETIIEGNKLIAEFMGMQLESDNMHGQMEYNWKNCPPDLHWPFQNAPSFHASWDWLMPVVEKISTIQFTDESWKGCEPYQDYAWPRTFGMRDWEGNYMVRFSANSLHHAPTLIEAAWLAVFDFIKWHNQNNLTYQTSINAK